MLRGEIGDGIDVRCLALYAGKLIFKTSLLGSKEELLLVVTQGEDQVECGTASAPHRYLQVYTTLEIESPSKEMLRAAFEILEQER